MQATRTFFSNSVLGVVSAIFSALQRRGNAAATKDIAKSAAADPAATRSGWSDRISRLLWQERQRDIDSALATAKDVFEVEARLRALERRVPDRYY